MLEDFKLKVFLKVSELGSFTEAAKFLGISQPAVSQAISDLEENVSTRLFERNRSGVTMTEKGLVFKQFAESIIKSYEDLNAVFSNYEDFAAFINMSKELSDSPLYERLKDKFLK